MKEAYHTKQIAMIGLFTAVLAVLSVLQIPMPSGVPLTLQTFAMALCGFVLGKKKAFAATALYLVIGAVGLPVFSGMKGGMGVLLGPTGGFLFGFLLLAFFCGWGMEMENKLYCWLGSAVGLLLCYALGAAQFSVVSGRNLWQSFLLVCVPYAAKDILSIAGAWVAARILRRRLREARVV